MKWFVLVVLLICYGGYVEMAVLKKEVPTSTPTSIFDEEDIPPSSPLGPECLAGSTWSDGCNACRCTRAGRRTCTVRTCPPGAHDNDRPRQHAMCAPNTTWTNPCAECSCSPDGVPGCYLKTCSHLMGAVGSGIADEIKDLPPMTIPLKKLNHSEAECLPGTSWRSACHSCECSARAVAECVKIPDCGDEEGEPIRCQPDSTFARDCNWCRCLESGFVLCTLRECAPFRREQEEVLGVGRQCELGTGWSSGCNRCHCDSSGEAYCTLDICPGRDSQRVMRCAPGTSWLDGCRRCNCTEDGVADCADTTCGDSDAQETAVGVGKECEPGTGWMNRCNKCYCSKDGHPHCAVNRCPGDDNEEALMQCAPGSRWQYECNGCYCTPEGHPMCTRMGCEYQDSGSVAESRRDNLTDNKSANLETVVTERRVKKSTCKPRESFTKECNICICASDGLSYSCTDNECVAPASVEADVEVFMQTKDKSSNKTVVCRANTMFVRDCNTCWCSDDGTAYFCTRRVCVPNSPDDVQTEEVLPEDLRIVQRECRPNEVFEYDCNMCRCNPDGRSFSCTRRLCVTDPPIVAVMDSDEQNTTLTRRPRRDVNNKGPVKTCLPGQEFRVDCNKCLCDNEGQDFSCTRLDCAALSNHNGGSRLKREVVQQDVNHCEPGTVFDQGCNVCRCTSDGHHATCSLKKCNVKPKEEEESQSDLNFRCTPGDQFTRDCNDCTCSADGRTIFCTLRLCERDIAGGM